MYTYIFTHGLGCPKIPVWEPTVVRRLCKQEPDCYTTSESIGPSRMANAILLFSMERDLQRLDRVSEDTPH